MSVTTFGRFAVAFLCIAVIALGVHSLSGQTGGRNLAFALALGTVFGIVLQRARFCFFCHARDYFEGDDARGLLAIVLAIAVGTVGMHIILGGWLPVPQPGRLPPDAHIGPVSWALVLAGLAFGFGMVISGSCISAHWYRLGEGSPVAPFALLGAALGFMLGFNSWNALYSATIATAPVMWLPHWLGYAGSAGLQLVLLGCIAAWLWRKLPSLPAEAGWTRPRSFAQALQGLFRDRWPYWIGGLAVGWIATVIVLRLRPLGVTAALGSAARDFGTERGWVPDRLDGLDSLGGCITVLTETWMTPNGLLILGLIVGSFAAALASGQCRPRLPTLRDAARGLAGGVLLGWGAMTGLGCTVGTLLSGTMAGAVSGWVFGIAVFAAVWAGLRIQARMLRPTQVL